MNAKNIPFQKYEVDEYEKRRYRGIDQRLVHMREKKILVKILKRLRGDSLFTLDIPCGYGRFSELLLEKKFALVNCDISFYMVKRAEERRLTAGQFLKLGVVADAKKGLPFKSDVFDCLFSIRFFHHIHDEKERELILKEFSRVSGRWLILTFYKSNFLHSLQRKLRKKIKKSKTRIKMISYREFVSVVERSGLSVVKMFPLFKGLHSQQIVLLKKN